MRARRRSRHTPADRDGPAVAPDFETLLATCSHVVLGPDDDGSFVVVVSAELIAAIDAGGDEVQVLDLPGTEVHPDCETANIRASELARGLS